MRQPETQEREYSPCNIPKKNGNCLNVSAIFPCCCLIRRRMKIAAQPAAFAPKSARRSVFRLCTIQMRTEPVARRRILHRRLHLHVLLVLHRILAREMDRYLVRIHEEATARRESVSGAAPPSRDRR